MADLDQSLVDEMAGAMAPAPSLSTSVPSDLLGVWQHMMEREAGVDAAGRGRVSPAGAMGYAQVMPNTAMDVAAKLGIPYDPQKLLNDRDYNEKIGAARFNELLSKYGMPMLAVAGYNAGEGRVDEWLQRFGDPRTGVTSEAKWAGQIPFPETRNYVLHSGAIGQPRDQSIVDEMAEEMAPKAPASSALPGASLSSPGPSVAPASWGPLSQIGNALSLGAYRDILGPGAAALSGEGGDFGSRFMNARAGLLAGQQAYEAANPIRATVANALGAIPGSAGAGRLAAKFLLDAPLAGAIASGATQGVTSANAQSNPDFGVAAGLGGTLGVLGPIAAKLLAPPRGVVSGPAYNQYLNTAIGLDPAALRARGLVAGEFGPGHINAFREGLSNRLDAVAPHLRTDFNVVQPNGQTGIANLRDLVADMAGSFSGPRPPPNQAKILNTAATLAAGVQGADFFRQIKYDSELGRLARGSDVNVREFAKRLYGIALDAASAGSPTAARELASARAGWKMSLPLENAVASAQGKGLGNTVLPADLSREVGNFYNLGQAQSAPIVPIATAPRARPPSGLTQWIPPTALGATVGAVGSHVLGLPPLESALGGAASVDTLLAARNALRNTLMQRPEQIRSAVEGGPYRLPWWVRAGGYAPIPAAEALGPGQSWREQPPPAEEAQ